MQLLVDISAHGFGHLAQTAPVLTALRQRRPQLRLTVRSGLPRARIAGWIGGEFDHIPEARDFGFVMGSAVDIDRAASAQRYREFHADFERRIDAEADWLRRRGVDALLANAAYLPLAGAAAAGLPAAGLSSLNWADLGEQVFAGESWFPPLAAQMRAAYCTARVFLRLEPGLPMPWLANARQIPPVAVPSRRDRAHFASGLGLDESKRWLLVAMGGMDFPLDKALLPLLPGACWLVQGDVPERRPDMRAFDPQEPRFADLLASCDLVITKPGYGTFVQAACAGLPILYLERPDWAETPYFVAWLDRHARAVEVPRGRLLAGDIADLIEEVWRIPAPEPVAATGAAPAAAILDQVLFAARGN